MRLEVIPHLENEKFSESNFFFNSAIYLCECFTVAQIVSVNSVPDIVKLSRLTNCITCEKRLELHS